MTKLYKSKLASTPHVVSATKYRDFLSAREPINETGKSYAYVCQRQKLNKWIESNYQDDTFYEPFIMSEDVFSDAYEVMA